MKSTLTSTSDSPTLGRFLRGPSTTATFKFGKCFLRYAAASWPVAPPPITNTSRVIVLRVAIRQWRQSFILVRKMLLAALRRQRDDRRNWSDWCLVPSHCILVFVLCFD